MTEIANAVKKHRPMLRNANINYSCGTFFVTMQAAFNKTIFGAIVGEKCVLNELGEAVAASFGALGEHYAGVEIDEFVVMPNHVHFIIKIGVAGLSPRPEKAGLSPRIRRGRRPATPIRIWALSLVVSRAGFLNSIVTWWPRARPSMSGRRRGSVTSGRNSSQRLNNLRGIVVTSARTRPNGRVTALVQ